MTSQNPRTYIYDPKTLASTRQRGKDFKSFVRQALSQYRDTANVKKGLETRSITAAFIPRCHRTRLRLGQHVLE